MTTTSTTDRIALIARSQELIVRTRDRIAASRRALGLAELPLPPLPLPRAPDRGERAQALREHSRRLVEFSIQLCKEAEAAIQRARDRRAGGASMKCRTASSPGS